MVVFSKRLDALARLAIVNSIRLDQQEAPQREAEQQQKEAQETVLRKRRPGWRTRQTFALDGATPPKARDAYNSQGGIHVTTKWRQSQVRPGTKEEISSPPTHPRTAESAGIAEQNNTSALRKISEIDG
jgi:hypothetical protein